MPQLTATAYVTAPIDMDQSHITGLTLATVDGVDLLFATTRLDGGLTAWGIGGTSPQRLSDTPYDSLATAGGNPDIVVIGDSLLTLDGGRQAALRLLTPDGSLGDPVTLGTTSTFGGSLGQMVAVTDDNATHVYGQITGAGGIGHMTISQGTLISSSTTGSTDIGAITNVSIGGMFYVVSAGATDNVLTTWAVGTSGTLTARDNMTPDDGLWVNAPTALDTAVVDGHTYVVLAAAGSNSLSVMHMDSAGDLTITDHLLDTRDSRIGGVTSLKVVTAGDHSYVIAGGADDGISIYQLAAGGQLIARAHLADTTDTGLANVSAITATGDDTGITIYVASGSENGVTQLRFETGAAGATLTATAAGGTLRGTDRFDMLTGGAGVDRILGGNGDDIIYDGESRDVLTGGAGADLFVLAADQTDDLIMDFTPGEDQLDLSAWGGLRSLSQLTIRQGNLGLRITYGDETLVLVHQDDLTLTPDMLIESDLLGTSRLPQTLTGGLAGPVVTPDLPERPDIPDVTPPQTAPDTIRTISGTGSNNRLNGGNTDDIIFGFAGDDAMYGLGGADQLHGGSGADVLDGGAGNDILMGGSGRDTGWTNTAGTRTQDTLTGGSGHDQLYGQSGADRLIGGTGDDIMTGGAGRDTFVFSSGDDTITDFMTAVDMIELDAGLWSGDKSGAAIVDDYAGMDDGHLVFDFGNGNSLTLTNITSTTGLADLINIV